MTDEKRTVFDLGDDIIASHIIPNLSNNDIKSLAATCHQFHSITNESQVWHQIFEKTFGVPYTESHYTWSDMFKMRRNAKLMTWGSHVGGRLGFAVERSVVVNRPTLVKDLKDMIITQVSAGGFSFQILNDQGGLFTTGSTWNGGLKSGPGPIQQDQFQLPINDNQYLLLRTTRISNLMPGVRQPPRPGQLPSVPTATVMPERIIHDTPPVLSEPQLFDSQFINSIELPNKVIDVSSGRSHFILLDDKGQIWSWDHPRQGLKGVNLIFEDAQGENVVTEQNIITKIVAGWNVSCCYVWHVGIVFWTSRDNVTDPLNISVKAHYKIIPNTLEVQGGNKVIDIVAGESFIVYLTSNGKIYRIDINGDEYDVYELEKFNKFLLKTSNSSSLTPSKFIKLSGGTFRTFVAIGDEDQVLIGTKDSNNPQIIKELQKRQITSVAVGDYHYLALTKTGELFSWGMESKYCGCLGLGTFSRQDTAGYKVLTPTKVEIEGKVLAIAAAGWQSCAIVSIDDK